MNKDIPMIRLKIEGSHNQVIVVGGDYYGACQPMSLSPDDIQAIAIAVCQQLKKSTCPIPTYFLSR